jgi:GNAT superfamily N-acetyltransferase
MGVRHSMRRTRQPSSELTSLREGTGMSTLHLRAARTDETALLSDLALRSKGYRGYDQAFLDACRAELTLAPQDVEAQRVTVAERDGRVVGFYILAGQPPHGTLEDLFVEPDHIGSGVGRALWEHVIDTARALGFEAVTLEAEPGAEPSHQARSRTAASRCSSSPS